MKPRPRALLLAAIVAALLLPGCPTDGGGRVPTSCSNEAGATRRPELTIISPSNQQIFGPDDTITWSLIVTDEDTAAEDLDIRADDLTTGVPQSLDVDPPAPDAGGAVGFVMDVDLIGVGTHVVRITVEDPDECTADDQLVLCVDATTCP